MLNASHSLLAAGSAPSSINPGSTATAMAQNRNILLQRDSTPAYSRADFTALRAWLNKLPIAQIASLYYDEDSLEALGCETHAALQRRLEQMRDTLADRAIDKNPHIANALRHARYVGVWSKALADFLVQAADEDFSSPQRSDPVSAWFKTTLATALKQDNYHTLQDLFHGIELCGEGWYRSVRRLGERKASVILDWLRRHEATLGPLRMPARQLIPADQMVVLRPNDPTLVPLERMLLPSDLDGSRGINRNTIYPQIAARNDLEAIQAYLNRVRESEKTTRAYRKELERFLLWCIKFRGKPMSSVLVEDCDAYKVFIANPPKDWIAQRTTRLSEGWRPFAGRPSANTCRYAIQVIRTFFTYLVNVRYLAGNPWVTVTDPKVEQSIIPLQIEKALPKALWHKLLTALNFLCNEPDFALQERYKLRGVASTVSMSAQYRLVRAAILLLGETGLRREELAFATRNKLKPVQESPGLWELDVLGKRSKWRTVFLPTRVIEALQAHWADRGQDFSYGMAEIPLISPVIIPETSNARAKHLDNTLAIQDNGFSQDGLYRLIKSALRRIANDEELSFSDEERAHLKRASTHAFRHTFGTHAIAGEVPLDVLQRVMGHKSLTTTTIYVQAEKKRSIKEMGTFLANRRDDEG